MGIPLDREIVDQRLRALGDLKCDEDLRLTIDNVCIDFDILVTTVLIKCSNTVHALTEQLVAKLPSRDEQSMGLYGDLPHKITVADMLIAAKCNGFDFVARASVHLVDQLNVGFLVVEIRGYFRIKIALALKKIDQISPALFH